MARSATQVLTDLLKNTGPTSCRLDVETSTRPDTALHSLFGRLEAFDPQTATVSFAPAGGHPCLTISQLRAIVRRLQPEGPCSYALVQAEGPTRPMRLTGTAELFERLYLESREEGPDLPA